MKPIISINSLSKTFKSGFNALENVSLDINKGEIFALLGPNGAGKTTLISIITGITIPTSGSVKVNNYDVLKDPIKTRSIIGLVPQEVAIEPFETVLSSIKFSRGLFGKPQDSFYINSILKQLSLWEKRNTKIIELSGGMKRRVLIAKALSHEPLVLFLDEPTAGVDVELRKDMWSIIRSLKDSGVTIILTTHYIEEAENLADRVGFINNGQISLIEEKQQLINKMGKKTLSIHIQNAIKNIPYKLKKYKLEIANSGNTLIYNYDINIEKTGITALLNDLSEENIKLKDILSPNLLIKNELQFPGILKNTFEISYPLTIFSNPYYPFYRNFYYKRDINGYNPLGEKITTYDTRTIESSIGAGVVFGKNLAIELSYNYQTANLEIEVGNSEDDLIDEYKNQITKSSSLMIDYDSRDDAQLTKKGSLINLKFFNTNNNQKAIFFDFDLYQNIGKNVFRFHGLSRDIQQDTFDPYIFFQGRADRAVGYAPYILSSNKLEMGGLEWRYNYKSYYVRLFYSEIFSLSQPYNNFNLDEKLSSYGYGLTFNSPFGLLELIVGKAPKTLSASSKKRTTFKVNLGYNF